ncbi:MAG: diguanylate cyclase [Pseudomonas sp.]|uniref:diguanylate cyclase domain-containing protein n=1 Tax=Pseudomonas sp. TaxID=306 RepID=UPI00272864BA|nr:diguanylate cyclase [Pseudomonas sp.]MDO9618177.1 diguanylate cyclase [Pseudomonas sp.]MDP2447011.1 diguanylate cyclase [Pseudomonas sp.]MDZ4332325.1 diguanylate cyclase [Pseudomonas sp.]
MNRRKPEVIQQRPSLRRLLHNAHLRVALLAMGLTSLSLTLVSLLALSTYASHNLQLIARSLAYTLEAAVVFNDRAAVRDALEQICKTEEIAQVAVFDKDGALLASLDAANNTVLNNAEQSIARLLLPDVVIQPITYQGQQIGALHLSGQGTTLLRFLIGGLLGLLASLALSALGATYGSKRIQRAITQPLRNLSQVAHNISVERTFNQRVPATHIADLNELAEDFNALLDQLEAWQHQLERENASLAHQASHDALTGLPNRAFFESRLLGSMREARDSQTQMAVLFLDSNRFKEINDQLGHAAGDAVLIAIAQRLRAQLREGDTVARLGGDEFAVLLKPIHHEDDAVLIADKIIDSMHEPIALPEGGSITTSLSIGIALYPEHADNPEALVHEADVAMYHAKRSQGGRTMARGQDSLTN